MTELILGITVGLIGYLLYEKNRAIENRKRLKHVIHVNGIRGKSTTTRLIHAGLRAGGYNTICKTTGTLPMVVDNNNVETLINREGKANIKEQLWIMNEAVKMGADVLVVECMAVDPRLQYVSEHKMLNSDIGVITNVRLDHTEEMGSTLDEICESLCNMIPKNGHIVTAEENYFEQIKTFSKNIGTEAISAIPKDEYSKIHFPENVAVAIRVCELLGVEEATALNGMENFVRDPYDLKVYRLRSGGIFVSGLSINDPTSCEIALHDILRRHKLNPKKTILLINNRPDRGYRAEHMIMLARSITPDEVWLMGAFVNKLNRELMDFNPRIFESADLLPLEYVNEGDLVFAVGNIGNHGNEIIARVEGESREYV